MIKPFFYLLVLMASSCISDSARSYDSFVKEYENPPIADAAMDLGTDAAPDVVDMKLPIIPQICSADAGDFVRVRFFNKTGEDGKVSRIKPDCSEEFVSDLNVDDIPFLDTFAGEVWSFRNLEGTELSRVKIDNKFTARVDFEVQK